MCCAFFLFFFLKMSSCLWTGGRQKSTSGVSQTVRITSELSNDVSECTPVYCSWISVGLSRVYIATLEYYVGWYNKVNFI